MKIKFIKPLPRIDHVIPIGHILDAPEGFAEKMIRTGRAVQYVPEKKPEPVVEKEAEEPVVEAEKPEEVEETPKPKARARKKRDAE